MKPSVNAAASKGTSVMIRIEIDRIEDGTAVCFDSHGRQYLLPYEADGLVLHEGDTLTLVLMREADGSERKESNRKLWEKIKSKGDRSQ